MNLEVNSATKFSAIYDHFHSEKSQGGYDGAKNIRFGKAKGLYLHSKLSLRKMFGWFNKSKTDRTSKRLAAGPKIYRSIVAEHGKDVADQIFKKVLNSDSSRTNVTLNDLDRIKRALPHEETIEDVKQKAIALSQRVPNCTPKEQEQFFAKHVDLLASQEFQGTKNAKYGQGEFKPLLVFALLDRLIKPESADYSRHDFNTLLQQLGVDPNKLSEQDRARLPQVTDNGVLREDTKDLLADLIRKNLIRKSDHNVFSGPAGVNIEGAKDIKLGKDLKKAKNADEKIQLLRSAWRDIHGSISTTEIGNRMVGAFFEMQGYGGDFSVDRAANDQLAKLNRYHEFPITKTSQEKLKQIQIRANNMNKVKKFLPGTSGFVKAVNKLDDMAVKNWLTAMKSGRNVEAPGPPLDPHGLSGPEKRYISNRMRTNAEIASRNGVEIDGKWIGKQIKHALRELQFTAERMETGKSNWKSKSLPTLHREAVNAGHSLVKEFMNPETSNPQAMADAFIKFTSLAQDFTLARKGQAGADDRLADMKQLIQQAVDETTTPENAKLLIDQFRKFAYAMSLSSQSGGVDLDSQLGRMSQTAMTLTLALADKFDLTHDRDQLNGIMSDAQDAASRVARNGGGGWKEFTPADYAASRFESEDDLRNFASAIHKAAADQAKIEEEVVLKEAMNRDRDDSIFEPEEEFGKAYSPTNPKNDD